MCTGLPGEAGGRGSPGRLFKSRASPRRCPSLLAAEAGGLGEVYSINSKGQRLFLAGRVRAWVPGGTGVGWGGRQAGDRGYFLRVCCLRACSRCRAPGVLDPAPMEKEGAADPKAPTPTKPWVGVEDAPKDRLLPDAPTPGAEAF